LVARLAARVRYRTTRVLPRTHMLLLVSIDAEDWIADVGFGLAGLLTPLPFIAQEETRQFAWTYRLVHETGDWLLQWREDGSWVDLYEFSLVPQLMADYEMANHYTSTHSNSRFLQTLTVQRIAPDVRHVLRNLDLTSDTGTNTTHRRLADDDELLTVLADTFDLRFPAGTRFPYRG
jgi:N-hydroxyarylamine O-acetyltransferase